MKKNRIYVSTMLISALFLLLASCKKETTQDTTGTQQLTLHINNTVGNTAANYSSTFTDNTGRNFNISDWRYYVSNVVLIKSDGSEYPISNKVVIVSPATGNYDMGQVPVGSYKGYRFYIGLDSATNHLDPATYPASDPLSIQTPSLHWGWNAGYIFMKIEGQYDSTSAGTGVPNHDYFYHLGMDMLRKTIDFSTQAFTVQKGTDKTLSIGCDLKKILNNVDMQTENSTHTMDDMPLAMKLSDNWTSAFTAQ